MKDVENTMKQLRKVVQCNMGGCDICEYYDAKDSQYPCKYDVPLIDVINNAIQTIRELQSQIPKWHLIKTRPLTDEEKEYYSDYPDGDIEFMYDCEMPDDYQKVLVATEWGVDETTYFTDCGCYFENYEDRDDVIAWCELPKFSEVE